MGGQQMQGAAKIMEKLSSLTFQKIAHLITAVDCQPMFDGGILVNVLGQLKTDEDIPQSFMQNLSSSHPGILSSSSTMSSDSCCTTLLPRNTSEIVNCQPSLPQWACPHSGRVLTVWRVRTAVRE